MRSIEHWKNCSTNSSCPIKRLLDLDSTLILGTCWSRPYKKFSGPLVDSKNYDSKSRATNSRSLVGLILLLTLWPTSHDRCDGQTLVRSFRPRSVDESRAAAAGIRKLTGRHITIYTDLAADQHVNQLTNVFDTAVPQWAEFFSVDLENTRNWKVVAYIIKDRVPFDALGLMPVGNDGFRHGFALGGEIWLYEQPSAYYRRHLLLHEGTHAFMVAALGRCGPGWFMEGMAELLATHNWDDKNHILVMRHMPRSKAEVPMLGRIKLLQDAYRENRAQTIPAVFAIDNMRPLENESYAWSWALARFLDDHPRYRRRFRSLLESVHDPEFNQQCRKLYADDWSDLSLEWEQFIASVDHAHDVARMAIDFQPGERLPRTGHTTQVSVDRGWQSSGVHLTADQSYEISARGRFQIVQEEDARIWWCEPGGVTIEYHAGRPLGMLLGAIDARSAGSRQTNHPTDQWHGPIPLGLRQVLTPPAEGTLYLRINDSPGRLHDNVGQITVTVKKI